MAIEAICDPENLKEMTAFLKSLSTPYAPIIGLETAMFRNLEELLTAAPTVLEEMVREFVRIANVHGQADKQSQATACSLLAIRSVSLLCSMGLLLRPSTLDGYDVLARSFLESRDLLTTFRFDNEGARKQIHAWFAGKEGWKPKHNGIPRKERPKQTAELRAIRRSLDETIAHLSRRRITPTFKKGQVSFTDLPMMQDHTAKLFAAFASKLTPDQRAALINPLAPKFKNYKTLSA